MAKIKLTRPPTIPVVKRYMVAQDYVSYYELSWAELEDLSAKMVGTTVFELAEKLGLSYKDPANPPERIRQLDMAAVDQYRVYSAMLGCNDEDQSVVEMILYEMEKFRVKMAEFRASEPRAMQLAEYADSLGLNEQNLCDYENWANGMPLGCDSFRQEIMKAR